MRYLINTWKSLIGVSPFRSLLMIDQAPRRDAAAPVVRFLDLAATEEDHGDVSQFQTELM
jgi:hypothetical protein